MKKLLLVFLISLATVLGLHCEAQETADENLVVKKEAGYSVRYTEQFNAKNVDELKLSNEHGYIHLSAWQEESIAIEVIVNIETRHKELAKDVVDLIDFRSRSYSRIVDYKTIFSEDFFSNYPFTINYHVKVPERLNLKIKNSIGDVKIDSIAGKINLTHAYGNLELTNIAKDKKHAFKLSFVEGLIDSFGALKADFNNCTLNLNNGDKLNGNTNYCMASFVNIRSVDIKTFTDRLTITNTDSLSIKGAQFIGKVDQLQTFLFCELEKGQLLVDASENVQDITISNKNVKTTLILPHSLNYNLNGEVSNGEFTHSTPADLLIFNENGRTSFSGNIGEENNSNANIILFNNGSSITIKH